MLKTASDAVYKNLIYILEEYSVWSGLNLIFFEYLIKTSHVDVLLDFIHHLTTNVRSDMLDVVLSSKNLKENEVYDTIISAFTLDELALAYFDGNNLIEFVSVLDKHTDLFNVELVKLAINNQLVNLLEALVNVLKTKDPDILADVNTLLDY